MAINCINYGLPNRSPKLMKRKVSTKKAVLSRCMLKGVELFNPEPMPYQKDSFKPCTVSRLVDIPRRINDGFMINDDISLPRQRGIILHKDRYDWSSMKDILKNQNERLAAEENYFRKAKFFKNLSEQKFKVSNQSLILEGEPMLPTNSQENKKEKNLMVDEDILRRPTQSITTNYNPIDDVLENSDSRRTVPMDVHRIKLNCRQSGGENINSAPLQSHATHGNMDGVHNMYLPSDGRDSFDRLPPINNKQMEFDSNFSNSTNMLHDFDFAYKQSERFNRPNVRLTEYIVDAVPVKFNERADIQSELRCLKSMALPTTARDLYIGRGIHLPSTHATKNPRGKYIHSSASYVNDLNNNMKIDTPGGGSVIINTKTPPHKNSPMPNNQIHLANLTDEKDETKNITETLKFEDIFNSLSPYEDGFVDKSNFFDYIRKIDKLSKDENQYFEVILHSTDKVSLRLVNNVLECIEIVKDLSPSFRETIFPPEDQKMRLLSPHLLTLIEEPISSIKVTTFYESILNDLDTSLTAEYSAELYKDFQKKINFDGNFVEDIPLNYILIFLPFLLQELHNK